MVTMPQTTDAHRILPETDAYVNLHLLDGGSFIGDKCRLHAGVKPGAKFRMYNWAFYIEHNGRHILWDLGMDEDYSSYTPWVAANMLSATTMVGPRRPIPQQLTSLHTTAQSIDTVLFSHAHWDHCRPIRASYPSATAYFGPGTSSFCSPGHLQDPNSQWDGRYFDPKQKTERWAELEGPWKRFGPFEKAMDYFGDGSFWVMQAPGHMAGNLCAAARIKGPKGGEYHWVLLGSDCCHSRELLDGTCEIASFTVPGAGAQTLHSDLRAAKATIEKIRILQREHEFHVALAHDAKWLIEGTDAVLMSLLDDHMKQAARRRIVDDEIP